MHRSFPLLVAVILLIGIAAAAKVANSDDAGSAQPGLQGAFSVLRTRPEAAPRRVMDNLLGTIPRQEANVLSARRPLAVRTRDATWVFATRHQVCLAQIRAASCASKHVARRDGVFLGTFRPPTRQDPTLHGFLVQGLVPNNVRKVLLVIGSHGKAVVSVRGNVFSFEADKPVHVKRLQRY